MYSKGISLNPVNNRTCMKNEHEHTKHNEESGKRIIEDIQKYGVSLNLIAKDDYLPGFAYTIGLYENYTHPEIIVVGLNNDVMAYMLNHAHDLIKKGEKFKTNIGYPNFLEGYTVRFLNVDKNFYPDYFGYAGWYYKNSWLFPAMQIIWPDKDANWPWQDEFNNHWKFKQPLLDRDTDFKFYESKKLGVYTTHHVIDGKAVLYVYHNDNGDWQFHSEFNPDPKDGIVVCLKHLVEKDITLNEVHTLGYGKSAWRKSINDEWNFENE